MKLGLDAIGEVCERLGRPEARVPSVLVAGTNGKGSTAAILSAIAHASGLRSGLYTSPHLISVTERLRIEEEDVSEEELDRALAKVFAAADRVPEVPVTYFEALTAAAFLLFAHRRLDLAILEVGLGGRFDATNVAPARLSVVTTISLDHTEELGATIPAIAR
ncbi:MAG TPA: bifunctional folylpolyglutamate synthase/dihydrofolate synthase, partial [Thermoanaerobaculia bacterium]